MANIILPGRFKGQPQYSAELLPEYAESAIFYAPFSDGTGRDASPSKNDLLPGVAPSPVVRPQGRTLNFDGSTQYLQTANTFATAQYTVMAWVTPTSVQTNYSRIVDTSHIDGFTILCHPTGNYAWVANGSGLGDCLGNPWVGGQRTLLVGTYDGATAVFYQDGVKVASVTWSAPMTARIISAGRNDVFGQYFAGDIDSPAVFSKALSDAEIWEIYQNPYRVFESPKRFLGLAAASGGTTVYNQSISGSLTATGGLTKQTCKVFAGSCTYAGALVKKTAKSYTGSLTASGNLNKLTTHSFAGSITPSGALSTMILFTCAIAGSLTASGALQKMTLKALAGASTISGALTKLTSKNLSASITVSGLLNRLTKKAFVGSVTATGALFESYQVLKSLAGSIKPTGVVTGLYIAFVAGVLKLLALMGVGQ